MKEQKLIKTGQQQKKKKYMMYCERVQKTLMTVMDKLWWETNMG
jgi:hypothetical protein